MKARTSWRGRYGSTGQEAGPVDDDLRALMNARFDEEGHIVHAPAEVHAPDPRRPDEGEVSKEHLQAAVEALAKRIEAAEAQGKAGEREMLGGAAEDARGMRAEADAGAEDLLHRLDLLEHRLEAMSKPVGGASKVRPGAGRGEPDLAPSQPARSASPRAAPYAGGLADFARDLGVARRREEPPFAAARGEPDQATRAVEAMIGDILREVRDLRGRMEDMRPSGQGIAAIQHRVGDIDEHLLALHDDLARRREPPQELLGEIAAIRQGLENLSSGRNFAEIEQRIVELGQRFDRLAEPSLERETLSRLEERLERLDEAVERIREGRAGALDELSRQLDQLAARVEQTGTTPPVDLAPLEARLAEIGARLEESTDTSAQFAALEQRLAAITERLQEQPAPFDPSEITDRLAVITEKLEERPAPFDPSEITDRLDRLAGEISGFLAEGESGRALQPVLDRLAALDDRFDEGRVDLEQLSGIVERMERSVAEAPAERLGALEERIALLAENMGESDVASFTQDVVDLRAEIAELRADIRNAPPTQEGALRSLQPAIRDIRERLDRLPQEPANFSRELEAQIGRISAMLDRPAAESEAMGRLEEALAGITQRLDAQDQHFKATAWQAADTLDAKGEGASDALMRLASALQNDLGELKSGAAAAEERTRQSLEAVHGTLEAVVKRMAFLERDRAWQTPQGGGGGSEGADRSAPQDPRPSPGASPLRLPGAKDGRAPDVRPAPPGEESPQGSGLLQRLSASQLLKRATGGRAESFSPRPEEAEAAIDSLLEPGTGGPLNSDLADAPSSTSTYATAAYARGGRQRDDSQTALARAYEQFRSHGQSGEAPSADFLNAARRAARAAAEEAAAAEKDARTARASGASSSVLDFLKARRRMLLAGAVALAVAFAAMQFIKQRGASLTADGSPATELQAPASLEESASVPPATSLVERQADASKRPMPTPDETTAFSTSIAALDVLQGDAVAKPDAPAGQFADAQSGVATAAPADAAATLETASIPAPSAGAPAAVKTMPKPDGGLLLPAAIGSDKLRRAAETGVAEAQFEIASRYAEGRGVMRDAAEAVRWYEKAARTGLAPAQYRLGSIYEKGRGVPKDIDRAFDWYEKAAAAGNVKAMHNLAVLHAEGAVGEPDLEKAAGLFERAAERGVRDSQFNIAVLYARGLGVPQDLSRAYKWFAVAARSGDQQARQRQEEIEQVLSPELLPQARQAAAAFKPLAVDPQVNMVFAPEGGWEDAGGETLHMGMPGLIQRAQDLLIARGYDPGPADGVFGEKTRQAIAAFQRDKGLQVSGDIDTGLIKALEAKDM
ncbi:peptidoglycan-binding protein [Afifella pfennigii]|uniref:peptidoglycan-binding protein n=1 Tax=Afifella pfennigii TaxID=209897 RepID=UPI00047A2932|nr:peptidoglycan-binding protein [Afifella pfennigii]